MRRRNPLDGETGQDARELIVSLSDQAHDMLETLREAWAQADAEEDALRAALGCDLPALLTRAMEHVDRRPRATP